MAEEELGKITHYFSKIGVGVINIEKGSISVGDKIHVRGHTSDFVQQISSMQVDHKNVESAKQGDSIGLKVDAPVREHDKVYKVTE